ncbi:MAG TPA: hypothetical protein PKY82_09760 [Pyrinomonadaceae bacterium]|nr:hypothetical protein [Pyrinomonadaceae bacterium]
MKFNNIILLLLAICLFSFGGYGQTTVKPKPTPATQTVSNSVKSSPAYAEVLLRKVELESDLESLLVSYKEDFPKVKEVNFELALIKKDLQILIGQADTSKLTLALGKLMVRKDALETDYWALQSKYGDEHPDVKRAKRKVLSFQTAIKEILD